MGKDSKSKKPSKKKAPKYIGLDKDGNPPDFPYVRTSSSAIHNHGLFAAQNIPEDDYVIQYLGELVKKKTATARANDQHDLSLVEDVGAVYIFELDDKTDIDGNFDWNIARLANHSCSPNCEAQNVDGEIWLVSLRDIKEGEEITFDYGYALEHWKDHPCLCGSDNCVGHIVRKEDWGKLKKLKKRLKNKKA
ncbi:SET domain-containing protein-lysine N-methyltransferase [Pelagicoccus sp. SDUM812002]|uniref:SET domain-containing protein n=1 Tax=Pelagicoccus sp. SDUM812002 TaxID=3041266 RepID=UPI00280CDE2E|nr:SET domain-containing protein-lysine N-methyltransferase [Pelagicoccus sp. SDUM812002]MDQ8186234.1 SET domain-containing protein-lysine N-methyltransferase [Pelagicoccus sp. SDUM812002]